MAVMNEIHARMMAAATNMVGYRHRVVIDMSPDGLPSRLVLDPGRCGEYAGLAFDVDGEILSYGAAGALAYSAYFTALDAVHDLLPGWPLRLAEDPEYDDVTPRRRCRRARPTAEQLDLFRETKP